MHQLRIYLALGIQECERYYYGQADTIATRAMDGRVVYIPASIIHRFITPQGILGYFDIFYDQNHKLIRIERVAET